MRYQSYWFKRLKNELEQKSKHIRFVGVRYGFYRIYFKNIYMHEVYGEMSQHGGDIYDYDPRIESQSYSQQYELDSELNRKIKNYIEGYWDSKRTIERRFFMMMNNNEYYEAARKAYQQMMVK